MISQLLHTIHVVTRLNGNILQIVGKDDFYWFQSISGALLIFNYLHFERVDLSISRDSPDLCRKSVCEAKFILSLLSYQISNLNVIIETVRFYPLEWFMKYTIIKSTTCHLFASRKNENDLNSLQRMWISSGNILLVSLLQIQIQRADV